MKTIVELFRDSIAFKIVVGVMIFLVTNEVTFGNEDNPKEIGKEKLDITFEQKFLEMNNIYNDHYLNY